MRNDLDGCGAGADDPDPLVGQAVQIPVRIAPRVRVVPPAGVERVTPELLDARDARELGPVQRAVPHDQETSRQAVAPVRVDGPASARRVPRNRRDLGGQARALVELEVLGNAAAVLEDLGGSDVLLARDIGGLLEEREVDVGLDVALCPRVPVPVPGAAEVAALLNDAEVVDARLPEPGAGDEAGETAADDDHGDVVDERPTRYRVRVGVVQIRRERSGHLDVLGVPIRPDPLVALHAVLLAQRIRTEVRGRRGPLGSAHRRDLLWPVRISMGLCSTAAPQGSPAVDTSTVLRTAGPTCAPAADPIDRAGRNERYPCPRSPFPRP